MNDTSQVWEEREKKTREKKLEMYFRDWLPLPYVANGRRVYLNDVENWCVPSYLWWASNERGASGERFRWFDPACNKEDQQLFYIVKRWMGFRVVIGDLRDYCLPGWLPGWQIVAGPYRELLEAGTVLDILQQNYANFLLLDPDRTFTNHMYLSAAIGEGEELVQYDPCDDLSLETTHRNGHWYYRADIHAAWRKE
jgi:hypothetical protein